MGFRTRVLRVKHGESGGGSVDAATFGVGELLDDFRSKVGSVMGISSLE